MKLKRASIAGVAIVIGAACLVGPRVVAWAQTLADTAAAGAAGATLGAAGGSGFLAPSQYAKKATDAGKKMQSMGKEGAGKGEPNMPNPTTAQAAQSKNVVKAVTWGNENGQEMLHQLISHPHSTYARGHVRKSRHHRNVLAKYRKPARGWLAYYLMADRYKVTSHDWRFTTTPNDKFYYAPWVLATKHRPAGDVIGFHTWQDAVIAGYRPDPVSLPAPGRQLAVLASYTQGPMLEKYIEYTYAGQITPIVFDANYHYVTTVAHQVQSSKTWSYLLAPTVEQAIGSTIGLAEAPKQVGSGTPNVGAMKGNTYTQPKMHEAGHKAFEVSGEREQSQVPAEYESALVKAGEYANDQHMSKQGVYDQLVSKYGEKFSAAAAQYAIDNVEADWNANALAKAREYQDDQHMSPAGIRDQLTSQDGEKFTQAQANYAIQHL